jgi:hypothetical protein
VTNKITHSLLLFAAGGLMFIGSASAQTQNSKKAAATPAHVNAAHPRVTQINRRESNQQKRTASGTNKGQLSPAKTRHLERGEKRLQKNEKRDIAKDNGHLTKKDQRQLNREANHTSARTAKDKHNAK